MAHRMKTPTNLLQIPKKPLDQQTSRYKNAIYHKIFSLLSPLFRSGTGSGLAFAMSMNPCVKISIGLTKVPKSALEGWGWQNDKQIGMEKEYCSPESEYPPMQ